MEGKRIFFFLSFLLVMGISVNSYAASSMLKQPFQQNRDFDWTHDKSLKLQKIDMDLARIFYHGIDIPKGGLSGMTITDKYMVFAQVTGDSSQNTKLNIVDKKTFSVLNTVESYCFGHANDMTYNGNTNELMVVVKPPGQIAKFKINDNLELVDVSFVDCVRPYSGISYDKTNNIYMAYSNGNMYILDDSLKEKYCFPLRSGLTPQGMAFRKGRIYYSCYESGNPKRKVFNSREKGSNLIYVYDLQGNLEKTLYIPNTTVKGEIENLDFLENGNLLIGYNQIINKKREIVFYKSKFKVH